MNSKEFHLTRKKFGDGVLYSAGSFFLVLFIVWMMGCREEIISPDNPVNNVNEIIEERSSNTFTFSINAENISFDVKQYPQLNSLKSRLSFNISDYSSGFTNVIVFGRANILFQDEFRRNLSNSFIEFSGGSPSIIQIRCENFTGKLRIQLSRIQD